ncbi:SMI1/KNR4 family protein [Achromobacter insuavis]|uniref:SMI1/KNR4 family protein n=1 Tax=Achromobacter insuavis TaxID=1287735 RepID=UPI003B9A60B2
MNQLTALVERNHATIRPARDEDIQQLGESLGFVLADEYVDYLSEFGVIVFGATETYGLGVPQDYYLNVRNMYADLSRDATYPRFAVPLVDAGDGRYYLYDNGSRQVLLWATPNGGIVETLSEGLEAFLVKQIFRP